jgi:hypothetical protein
MLVRRLVLKLVDGNRQREAGSDSKSEQLNCSPPSTHMQPAHRSSPCIVPDDAEVGFVF